MLSEVEGANASNDANDNVQMATVMVGTVTVFDNQIQTWEEYVKVLEHICS